jgi:hypothetical protein
MPTHHGPPDHPNIEHATGHELDRVAAQYGIRRTEHRPLACDLSGLVLNDRPRTDEQLREMILRRFNENRVIPMDWELIPIRQVSTTVNVRIEPPPPSRWERLLGDDLI